ncbi:MAG: dihydropteroate synthase [Andreesenia angusta]|nr:dihydropteroate synthase [Andreesenia angusta]
MRNIRINNHRKIKIPCGKYSLNLGERTLIMGILNITPDSFSDGGKYDELDNAVKHAKKMAEEGADIIDIGAESTRPGHTVISVEEEKERLIPIVKAVMDEVDLPISVDTYKSEVAEAVLKMGVPIINDIWGLQRDPEMAKVIAKYDAIVVSMHNNNGTEYEKDIVESISDYFRKSIEIGIEAGIPRDKIILDPGIGFGKDTNQNLEVMSRLGELNDLGCALLLGTSKKSMIGNVLDLPSDERVEGTIATSVMGTIQNIDIVRVHNVKENYRALKLTDTIVRGLKWEK